MSAPSYEDVPYESVAIPYASPAAIALAARLTGGPRPALDGARVLELGCGDGAHLLPLAFHHPRQRLVGVDASPAAIARATEGAAALGLDNVRFVCADLSSVALDEPFDFVIAHGLYSWIDPGRRAALRELMARTLSAEGLAYVSFNALPGWGVRGRVRDVVRGLSLDAARARAAALRETLGDDPWERLLARELDRVIDGPAGYLTHEYLTPHNQAFWLREVVADFAAQGLRYAGDALALDPDGFVEPTFLERVAELEPDPIARTELADLCTYRQLHAAVFAREEARWGPAPGAAILEEAQVFGVVRPERDPFDAQRGVEERFVTTSGVEVRVGSALAKMALLVLATEYPNAYSLPALIEEAEGHVVGHGIAPDLGERERLTEGVLALVRHRALELRLERPTVRTTQPVEPPRANALARWEAERRGAVTTAIHTALPLDPVDRAILARLDGEREREAIVDALVTDVEVGALELEGAPTGAMRLRPLLADRVERLLPTLSWWGILD